MSSRLSHALEQCNILVNTEGNCVITDFRFGQSELTNDAYKLSGRQRPNETPRWPKQVPEVSDVVILSMGGILEHDARPGVSDAPFSMRCCLDSDSGFKAARDENM
ncbi:hypothetical protein BDR07DRAFT_1489198 [Suillus spraguei]|nr:hypothetical protein BDR07DRAFT_1501844 [Suillus spraguei]KAG2351885.1 hypothetical protein BDR07DRAFT_1499985 [Suillus spraguei]KAG2351889.1 hypothetical protein BDR07DRAFT_1499967 [Suillus spraguei]KAG2353112.1 hypothetical protein BDR07DRAFT_1496910 [Suillus spraguei]KAG2353705.1 hypothetical protein BDR07DRAFT_1495788 [Suillus spraguei]